MAAPLISRRSCSVILPSVMFFTVLCSLSAAGELQTLLAIKAALQNPNTKIFDSWKPGVPACNFTGITCGPNGSVKEIELSGQGISGSVHFDSICSLRSLEKLSLGFNSLSGNVSDGLNRCVSLTYLNLGNNFFSGAAPGISSLNELTHLYLNNSGFTGMFPWDSLKNMTKLEVLCLGDNPFDRSKLPEFVVQFPRLKWLYLSNCSLEGKIPDGIGNLTALINLELSMNYISGEIPAGITKLRRLWQLELYNNEITGKLPVGLGNLSNLEYFDASANFLYGDLSEIGHLNRLKSLQLFENEFTGVIPPELGEFQNLANLSLYTNKLSGPLPPKLGSLSEFYLIDASENFLTGPIPPEMCKQGKMKMILLLQNNLTGEIPQTYTNCTSLKRFRVSKNLLSGVIPAGIWGLPELYILDIANNKFEGSITGDIKNAKTLAQLYASNNRLSGELPSEISGATALVAIELGHNQLSGEIPATIGKLKSLDTIHLQENKFSGSIPESLGECVSLSDINMASNSLNGPIPSSLQYLSTLTTLDLSGNQLSGEIPASLSQLKLNLLDLSNNTLSGSIPDSLSIDAYNGSFAGNSRLCSRNINSFRKCSPESQNSRFIHPLLISLFALSSTVLLSLACFFYLKKSRERSLKDESWDLVSFRPLTFEKKEILDAVKQENIIGEGGSGSVYRVILSNGTELAAKHIWNSGNNRQGPTLSPGSRRRPVSKQFEAEVQTLSSIRHMNVVKLYCCMIGEDSNLLVYEYMPNGSLWDILHTTRKMKTAVDWEMRYEIAVGAAKGLEYLHHGLGRPIVHRDVKSSNILLDEDFRPRIADFGLAKMIQCGGDAGGIESTHVIAGTHGYIAPEYGYTQNVKEKSDVYSFGVVLMELVSGKKPIEAEYGENNDIVSWVSGNLKSKETIMSLVDPEIPEHHKEDAIKVLRIAILCTNALPNSRPTMKRVVQLLKDAEPCKLVGEKWLVNFQWTILPPEGLV
ncbi:unnamed protein product [Cuscuta campestris]|uniref:Protein kinase domain-containing protein n=1 Tax=Cuscuta campestris TaxID=132261 RepID=A0A484MDD3_9ASTE|nr:unnamed protein product [Cuscuta campestris]